MNTTIDFRHNVEGVALDLLVTAEFEPRDASCNVSGGWFLLEAELDLSNAQRLDLPKLAAMIWDRSSFALMFGLTALRVVEEAAADFAMDRANDRDREYEEVEA